MRIWGTGLLTGMAITMRNMLRGPITVQYPHEKIQLPERARWALQPKMDEQGNTKCTACMSCVRACPDYIIDLQTTTGDDRSKHIDRMTYEVGACMMCGLCVEACPFDAIEMGQDYELARVSAAELTVDLLVDVPAAAPKRDKPAAAAPAKPAAAAEKPAAGAKPEAADPAPAEAPPAPEATEGGEPTGE